MGAALIHKRELVAEIIREAKATLEREGLGATRTVSVKIRIHKDLRYYLQHPTFSWTSIKMSTVPGMLF
jgi:tRNA-dihydrouridine synthase 4